MRSICLIKSIGAIEQAIANHPLIAESCVVGMPDPIKGQQPFAFLTLSSVALASSGQLTEALYNEIWTLVRQHVGPVASLAGAIQGVGIIPKTRSGKILRRVLRDLLSNGVNGQLDKDVVYPSTIEDLSAISAARECLKEYFQRGL